MTTNRNQWLVLAVLCLLLLASQSFAVCLNVTRILGRGSFGVVYQVVDPQSGQTSAVKVLSGRVHPQLASRILVRHRDFANRRFYFGIPRSRLVQSEAPSALELLFSGSSSPKKVLGIRMELAPLNSQQYFDQSRADYRFSALDLRTLIQDIRLALREIQELGYVHHDPNPRNIFVQMDRRGRIVFKLGDFDLIEPIGMMPHPSAYEVDLAPIDFGGLWENKYHEPSIHDDIFQLAATVFHIIYGKSPFELARSQGQSIIQARQRLFENRFEYAAWWFSVVRYIDYTSEVSSFTSPQELQAWRFVAEFMKLGLSVERAQRIEALDL